MENRNSNKRLKLSNGASIKRSPRNSAVSNLPLYQPPAAIGLGARGGSRYVISIAVFFVTDSRCELDWTGGVAESYEWAGSRCLAAGTFRQLHEAVRRHASFNRIGRREACQHQMRLA